SESDEHGLNINDSTQNNNNTNEGHNEVNVESAQSIVNVQYPLNHVDFDLEQPNDESLEQQSEHMHVEQQNVYTPAEDHRSSPTASPSPIPSSNAQPPMDAHE
ncbi:hypothetical protein Dimus_024370, partial [Dionaea muscipula]